MSKSLIRKFARKFGYEFTIHPVSNSSTQHKAKGLIYVHIPKCGGMSIDEALRKQLAQSGEYKIKRKPLIRTNLATFHKELKTLDDACDFSEYHAQENQKILRYHLNQHWHYVSGHLTVSQKIIEDFKAQYQFVTVLRDPVERFISNYLYNKMTNTSDIMLPNNLSNMTIDGAIKEAEKLITSRRGWHMANTLTLFITGRYPIDEADALLLQQEFDKNLSHFSAVGFLSNLEYFCDKVTQLTSAKINIPHKNATKNHFNTNNLEVHQALHEFFNDTSTRESLNQICKYDIDNYNRALKKYGE